MASTQLKTRTASLARTLFARALGYSHGGERDLYEQFGYDREVPTEQLFEIYRRNDIANRIIKAFPQATWRDAPVVRDEAGDSAKKGTASYSPFAEAVEDLFDRLRVTHHFERSDRLASVGRYGVLYMGFRGSGAPNTPLADGNFPLLYLQAYGELSADVAQYDADPESPRFGLPLLYNLQPGKEMRAGGPTGTIVAHHSRLIHIAEALDQDNAYGVPRLLPIFNRLKDLEKVVGGAAETFWLTANRGLALIADADAKMVLTEEDIKDLKSQADEFANKLRRTLVGAGVKPHVLGSESPDPGPIVTALLDLIAGTTGIPKRILIGSERGELSSAQDENNWTGRTDERRASFAAPCMVRPFVDTLIRTKNLPKPKGAWWVEWPELGGATELEKAAIAASKMAALASYANTPGAEFILPRQEFRTDYLGTTPESEYDVAPVDDFEEPETEDEADNDNMPAAMRRLVAAVATGRIKRRDAMAIALAATPGASRADIKALIDPIRVCKVGKATIGAAAERRIATLCAIRLKTNARPRTLYVSRPVLNADAILKWAKAQGFKAPEKAAYLHVTIAYSRAPLDWMKVPALWNSERNEAERLVIPAGGARVMERLGPKEAAVLLFISQDLTWRHSDIIAAGASWDWAEYQPHVTISYGDQALDLDAMKAYRGRIELGPEAFEIVDGAR